MAINHLATECWMVYVRCPNDIHGQIGIVFNNDTEDVIFPCVFAFLFSRALFTACPGGCILFCQYFKVKPAYCSSTINVTNGVVRVNKAYLGEEANGTCNQGYSPMTNSTMKCMVKDELSGVWTNVLSCNRKLHFLKLYHICATI